MKLATLQVVRIRGAVSIQSAVRMMIACRYCQQLRSAMREQHLRIGAAIRIQSIVRMRAAYRSVKSMLADAQETELVEAIRIFESAVEQEYHVIQSRLEEALDRAVERARASLSSSMMKRIVQERLAPRRQNHLHGNLCISAISCHETGQRLLTQLEEVRANDSVSSFTRLAAAWRELIKQYHSLATGASVDLAAMSFFGTSRVAEQTKTEVAEEMQGKQAECNIKDVSQQLYTELEAMKVVNLNLQAESNRMAELLQDQGSVRQPEQGTSDGKLALNQFEFRCPEVNFRPEGKQERHLDTNSLDASSQAKGKCTAQLRNEPALLFAQQAEIEQLHRQLSKYQSKLKATEVAGSDVSKANSHWAEILAGAEARMAENSKALANALAENDKIRRTHQDELDRVRKETSQCGISHLHKEILDLRYELQTKLFAPQKVNIEEVKLRAATVAQASTSSMKKNAQTKRFHHSNKKSQDLRPGILNNSGLATSARMQRPRPQVVRRGNSMRQLLIEDDASISEVSVDTSVHSMKDETFKQPSNGFKDTSEPQSSSDPYDSSSDNSCLTPRDLNKRLTSTETPSPVSTARRSQTPCDHVDLDRLVTMLMHERGENDAICVDLKRVSKSLQEASPVASTRTASGCTALWCGC